MLRQLLAIMNNTLLENRISGTPRTRFLLELFGNTAIFPLANIVFELLIEGLAYLRAPDVYIILAATFAQAYFLSRWEITSRPRRLVGNLIGPVIYTLIEGLLEGPRFFVAPHHLAYWGFALVIGILQAIIPLLPGALAAFALLLENITRASILFLMYGLFEVQTNPAQTVSLPTFFGDASHQFIAAATFLLGLGTGLANLMAQSHLRLLRQTSAQLRLYSEWLLGRDLLNRIVANPNSLALTRQERTILFMDIRNFTGWSETHATEQVASLLNQYYRIAESVLLTSQPIKYKFSADEVLSVFGTPTIAIDAAIQLGIRVNQLLAEQNLAVGIGLHTGEVVEGLLGSSDVKFYDVVGDAVNVAKRIESNAKRGEILISDRVLFVERPSTRLGEKHEITVKGKSEPLAVYPILYQDLLPNDVFVDKS